MATYHSLARTNYFSVTDESAFRELMSHVKEYGAPVNIWERITPDGKKIFGFGGYENLDFYPLEENGEEADIPENLDAAFPAIQKLLAEGDAMIIMDVGHESMRFLTGYATVVTKNDVEYLSLTDLALSRAREILNNPDWDTAMDY